MRKLRLTLKILGIFLAAIGISNSSCKKDDDEECVTCTIDASSVGGEKTTEKVCEDDKNQWEDYADSWKEYKDYLRDLDDEYDFVSCKF